MITSVVFAAVMVMFPLLLALVLATLTLAKAFSAVLSPVSVAICPGPLPNVMVCNGFGGLVPICAVSVWLAATALWVSRLTGLNVVLPAPNPMDARLPVVSEIVTLCMSFGSVDWIRM